MTTTNAAAAEKTRATTGAPGSSEACPRLLRQGARARTLRIKAWTTPRPVVHNRATGGHRRSQQSGTTRQASPAPHTDHRRSCSPGKATVYKEGGLRSLQPRRAQPGAVHHPRHVRGGRRALPFANNATAEGVGVWAQPLTKQPPAQWGKEALFRDGRRQGRRLRKLHSAATQGNLSIMEQKKSALQHLQQEFPPPCPRLRSSQQASFITPPRRLRPTTPESSFRSTRFRPGLVYVRRRARSLGAALQFGRPNSKALTTLCGLDDVAAAGTSYS